MPRRSDIKRLVCPVHESVAARLEVLAAMERRSVSNYIAGIVLEKLESTPEDVREIVMQRVREQFGETAEPAPQTKGESDLSKMIKAKAEETGMNVQTIKRLSKIKDGSLSW